jgi:serine/threonine protein kinase
VTPQEWQRARRVLQVALTCPPAERRRSIAEQCGDTPHLRRQIEALLASYDDSTDLDAFLNRRQHAGPGDALSPPFGSSDQTRTADSPEFIGAEPPPDAFAESRRWAEFALLEEIGKGAFGVVYRAWDSSLNREIALKIIDARELPHGDNHALLREGQMLARVHHHNVVTVYRAERIGQQVGLAMEYIEGRTLSNLVAQHGPLNAQEASLIGASLCDALAAVHRGGLVHRDVKASNVMRESGGRIVLMDFGAGRELLREHGTRSRVLGTPAYMPPEVLRGSNPTASADLYSLGVLLFFLVTGKYPVEGSEFDEVLANHDDGRRLLLRDVRGDLPDPFVALVERATDAETTRRPRSAGAFKRELLDSVPGAPRHKVEVKPGTRETRPRPARRWGQLGFTQRIALTLVGGLLLLIALGFLTTLEFNSVLGRTGAFGTESPLGILRWGANSLLAPTIYVALVVVLFNVAVFVFRFTGRVIPPVRRAAVGLKETTATWARDKAIDEPNDLLRGLAVLGLLALVVILWNFLPLLKAFTLQINQAPSADLAILGGVASNTNDTGYKFLYRRLLELDLLLLGIGLLGVLRIRRRRGTHLIPSAVVSVIAVMGLVLVFLVGPWRLMFHSKFRQATWNGQSCFVLSERDAEVLLHCPQTAPPRNRIVRASDPALRIDGPIAWLFDAHQAAAGKTGKQ